jgi:hypothetical protein
LACQQFVFSIPVLGFDMSTDDYSYQFKMRVEESSLLPWWPFLCSIFKTRESSRGDDKVSQFQQGSVVKPIDDNSCQHKMMNIEESSLPPWWSWEFLCEEFTICSQTSTMDATDATRANDYDDRSFKDDTTISSIHMPH